MKDYTFEIYTEWCGDCYNTITKIYKDGLVPSNPNASHWDRAIWSEIVMGLNCSDTASKLISLLDAQDLDEEEEEEEEE